ncbi:HPP family protein [Nocardioides yefusunii]|uniref:HPP family protein n=1 Tax=Nocardioides yefusunii TaxID=2500546 RepID=A0ABW1QUR7_9ACTN|nr:HPP family protein [Nocardioides yefusunii]
MTLEQPRTALREPAGVSGPVHDAPRRARFASQAPPRPPWGKVAAVTVTVAVGLLLLAGLGEWSGHLLLIPAMAGTMALVAAAPALPLAQPRNIVIGQTVSVLIGVGVGWMSHSLWAAAVAAALAVGVMLLLRSAHAPAAATCVLAVETTTGQATFVLCALAAAVVLTLTAWISGRFTRTGYPTYWW